MSVATDQSVAFTDASLHVWPVHMPAKEAERETTIEVELIASHTSDPSHLDPSCPACRRVRSELLSIAQMAVQRVASAQSSAISFDVYADPACIVCSPRDGQRPCVTVSIYLSSHSNGSAQNGSAAAVSQMKQVFTAFGIRER